MNPEKRFGPVIAAGLLMGVGMGGLLDSVLLRQVLGLHAFLSTSHPVKTAADLKTSFQWDGIFSVLWIVLLIGGIVSLYNSAKEKDVPISGQLLFGSWFLGWGAFILIEGLVSHHLLKLHHLLANANPAAQETGDYAYLVVGALIAVLGYWAIASTRSELENAERDARRAAQRAKEVKGDRKVYLD